MLARRLLLVGAVTLTHFVSSISIAAYLWSHGMNEERNTVFTYVAGALLPVLHTPFVPRFWVGTPPTTVALDSIIWGITLGLVVPAAWRALRVRRAAA